MDELFRFKQGAHGTMILPPEPKIPAPPKEVPRNNGGHDAIQHDAFNPGIDQMFEAWRQTPGGKHVLRHAYRITAPYAARYKRTGRRVSVRLIWETLRDALPGSRRGWPTAALRSRRSTGFA